MAVRLMGILNATPDSFFGAGRTPDLKASLRRAERMAAEGADWFDVGGESTRPGAAPVPLEEELRRVVPLVRALARRFPEVPVSVDTQKAEVARQSLSEGARMVNDVSALRFDPAMSRVLKESKPRVVLMHMRGDPRTMQKAPRYRDIVADVKAFLSERIRAAVSAGIPKSRLWVDPGIGFGKTVRHNLEILARLKEFASLGCPLLVGVSRKRFIGVLGGSEDRPLPPEARLEGSLAAACWAASQGAAMLRVHDVGATRRALSVFGAIGGAA